jgi:hypothetical protein
LLIAKMELEAHRERVETVHGFKITDLGTHSIRKGALTYMSSLPGGPPVASSCIRAGWSMGKVEDIYPKYMSNGDQFCGRGMSLLPLLDCEFAESHPCPKDEWRGWLEVCATKQFYFIWKIVHLKKLLLNCFCSLVFHIESFVIPLFNKKENHVLRNSALFRDSASL